MTADAANPTPPATTSDPATPTPASDPATPTPAKARKATDTHAERPRSMKPFILLMAGIVVVGAAIAIVYKMTEEHPQQMTFRLDDGLRGQENATVLDATELRGQALLKAHLDTAIDAGHSIEDVALRVDELRRILQELTRETGPTWIVLWKDHVVVITASGA